MGDCMNDINDAYASGLLSFPKTSEEEWEKRRIEEARVDAEHLQIYKLLEGSFQHVKNGGYFKTVEVLEVKSYHNVVIRRLENNNIGSVAIYDLYKVKLLHM